MKSHTILLLALGLASSATFAQSARSPAESDAGKLPQPETVITPPAESTQMPAPVMGSDAGATPSAASSGQLITPAIAQSRPATEGALITAKPRTENGVTYMCGGVGEDESRYMKQTAAGDYDLMMTFAERNGNYVADVAVSIKDARGKTVLDTTCDGPILLVDLPSGGYRIHAEADGRALDRTALVKAGKGPARQVTFAWPNSTGS